MGRIQSSVGLVSGIDIKSTVEQLISISAQPRDRLLARNKDLQSQQTAIGELTALVIAVQLGSDRLKTSDNFKSIAATSSDSTVLAATASSGAVPGRYQFTTVQTAQTAALTSNSFVSADETLSEGDLVVRAGGFVDGTARLDDLRGGSGISLGKLQITDRSGATRTVDLRFASSIDDVLKKINTTEGLDIQASVDGDRIVLADTSGETASNLIVEEVGTGRTATDLGLSGIDTASNQATGDDLVFLGRSTRLSSLLDGRGIHFGSDKDLLVKLRDGSELSIDLNKSGEPTTLGQLIDRINAKDDTKLTASISADGNHLELEDLTTGSHTFQVSSPTGNAAQQLGFDSSAVGGTITGQQLLSGLSGPLLGSLNGGEGFGELGEVDITNRAGVQTTVDLSSANTLRDVIDLINDSDADVVASLNGNRTGILIQDGTGDTSSHLIVADGDSTETATKLNLAADTVESKIDSGSLKLQYISENTALSSLHHGAGVRFGTFKITDAAGQAATINLTSVKFKTVGDVIDAVNKLDIGVEASLNEEGDGFVIFDTSNGSGTLTIADVGSGKTAADLAIAGSSKSISVGGQTVDGINSSQTLRLTVAEDTTLTDLVLQINSSDGPVSASLLSAGPNNVRLLLTSKLSGEAGRIAAEGDSLGTSFSVTAQGRDATIAVGASDDTGGTLIRSNSNTFDNVLTGLQLQLSGISDKPIEISVTETTETAEKNIKLFVDQYNKVVDRLKALTSYDPSSNATGLLFGSGEALRVETSLAQLISGSFNGVGNIKSAQQLGLSLDDTGRLSFDAVRFKKQVEKDPESVQTFFTTENTGFSARAKRVLDVLSGAKSSVLINVNKTFQDKINTNNKRIEGLNLRIEKEKTRLTNQFYAMEATISKLKNSLNSLASIQSLTA